MITGVSIDGQRLKALRKERGLTQVDLAERAPVHRSVLSHAENARHYSPSLLYAWRLAEALGVSLADLVVVERGGQPAEPMRAAS